MMNKIVRKLELKNKMIEYELTIKDVKNINLRIFPNGKIFVSANRGVKFETIDEFIISKADNILSILDKFANLKETPKNKRQYINGETFKILDKIIYLKVHIGREEKVRSDGRNIYLTVKETSGLYVKQALVNNYLDNLSRDIFTKIIIDVYPIFKEYNVPIPTLKIKNMKTVWGSCMPSKNQITLNKKLLSAPEICIKYIIIHEFCHFIHPNHSKEFHSLVTKIMPNWKEYKDTLNKNFTSDFNY